MMISFIDPGVHMCGVADFYHGKLVDAVYVSVTEAERHVKGKCVMVEVPRVYPSARQKGDQNDLIDLAVVCGRMLGLSSNPETVYPRQWKGSVDADVMTERIIKIAKERKEDKIPSLPSAKSKQHNVWDAVGIGYWYFKYLNQRKIFRGESWTNAQ